MTTKKKKITLTQTIQIFFLLNNNYENGKLNKNKNQRNTYKTK